MSKPDYEQEKSKAARAADLIEFAEAVLQAMREHPDAEAEATRSVEKGWGSESDEIAYAAYAQACRLGLLQ